MMKRFLALLLLALMLPWCALAQEGTLNAKTATRTGPGTCGRTCTHGSATNAYNASGTTAAG